MVLSRIEEFNKSEQLCAVCVGLNKEGYTHCGILYKFDNKSFLIHLGSPIQLDHDDDIKYHKEYSNYIWTPLQVDLNFIELIITRCQSIFKKNPRIPYGILHDESTYFDDNGLLVLGVSATGLTCSTFVKTILKDSGVDVIDEIDWPDDRESDLEWVKSMIALYENIIKSMEVRLKLIKVEISSTRKLYKLEKDQNNQVRILLRIGQLESDEKKLSQFQIAFKHAKFQLVKDSKLYFKRFRPEEVAVASYMAPDIPLKFSYEDKKGMEILGQELLSNLLHFPKNK